MRKDIKSGGKEETIPLCKELLRFYQTVKEMAPFATQANGPSLQDA
jgi:hypothetical protein